jgi:hypothetical protein
MHSFSKRGQDNGDNDRGVEAEEEIYNSSYKVSQNMST